MRELIWTAKDNHRISLYVSNDRERFEAVIHAGIGGETFLSVGYSSPNGADVEYEMLKGIQESLDKKWESVEMLPLDGMLPALLDLCKEANSVFNKMLFPTDKRYTGETMSPNSPRKTKENYS